MGIYGGVGGDWEAFSCAMTSGRQRVDIIKLSQVFPHLATESGEDLHGNKGYKAICFPLFLSLMSGRIKLSKHIWQEEAAAHFLLQLQYTDNPQNICEGITCLH